MEYQNNNAGNAMNVHRHLATTKTVLELIAMGNEQIPQKIDEVNEINLTDKEKKNARQRAWRHANKDKVAAGSLRYRIKHKDRLTITRANNYQKNKISMCLRAKEYQRLNSDRLKIAAKQYRESHKEEIKEKSAKQRALNKDKLRISKKIYREKNSEEIKKKEKEQRLLNPEKYKTYAKKYYAKNKEKIKETVKKYRIANPEKIAAAKKLWVPKNPEKYKETRKKWRTENPEKIKAIRRKHEQTIGYKINHSMRRSIGLSIKGNKDGRRWEDLVGFTFAQFKKHMEKQFTEGMTWENHGDWHIDHILPKSKFNFEKPEDEDFKKCWALKNLQPLWAADNLKKHAKLSKHLQPSLIF